MTKSSVGGYAMAETVQDRYVRLAEIENDPLKLDAYQAAVSEEIEASVRVEPGVLALYAVAAKDNPAHIRVFEIYADEAAYKAHRETPHFNKYKARYTAHGQAPQTDRHGPHHAQRKDEVREPARLLNAWPRRTDLCGQIASRPKASPSCEGTGALHAWPLGMYLPMTHL